MQITLISLQKDVNLLTNGVAFPEEGNVVLIFLL